MRYYYRKDVQKNTKLLSEGCVEVGRGVVQELLGRRPRHHQRGLSGVLEVVGLVEPTSVVVELLRVEESLVYAFDFGLAADSFGFGGVSRSGLGRDRFGGEVGVGRMPGEGKGCFELLIEQGVDFGLLLPDDAVRVLVPDFVFLLVAATLDAALVADEVSHLLVEGVGPEWSKAYLRISLDLILSRLSSRKRI